VNTANEPIPVLPLEYAKPATGVPLRSRRWLITANVALFVAALDVLAGWVLIFLIDAETVLMTAPILFLAGLVLILACRKVGVLLGMISGLAHCAICLLFAMLVNVRNWSPSDATRPFTVMAGVYLILVVVPVSAAVFLRLRRVPTTMAPISQGFVVAPITTRPTTTTTDARVQT
jgi:hypothetical protein